MANETAANVTADLDREAEATRRRSSTKRDLSAIDSFLEVLGAPIVIRLQLIDRESSLSGRHSLCETFSLPALYPSAASLRAEHTAALELTEGTVIRRNDSSPAGKRPTLVPFFR